MPSSDGSNVERDWKFSTAGRTSTRSVAEPSGSADGFHQALEEAPSVRPAMRRLEHPLRMRHHPEDVAAVIEDAGYVTCRSIDFAAVAEGHTAFAFQPVERFGIGRV